MRGVILYPGEDGYWAVECLCLPGCTFRQFVNSAIHERVKSPSEKQPNHGCPL